MERKDADMLLKIYGRCWMEEDTKIEYLAVVYDDKNKGSFIIEKGVREDDYSISTKNVTYEHVPLVCKLKKIENFLPDLSSELQNSITETETVIVRKRKGINKISLQNICKHKIRPVVAGCEIQNDNHTEVWGSIGAFLKISPIGDKITFALTNHHVVLKENRANKEDLIFQPNNYNNDYSNAIGKIKFSHFGKTSKGDFLDVAFIELLNSNQREKTNHNGFVWSSESTSQHEPYLDGILKPEIDMDVKIFGKTSGLESNTIISDNAHVRIELKTGKTIFEKQVLIKKISQKGDSGSVVINNNKVVGLLFAGDGHCISVANNINAIFDNEYMIEGRKRKIKFKKFLT
ncbi:hypothetical protein MHTCC0001_21400 [Flavobacteriaceae bacterium MHTCC 0001]